MNRIRTSVRFLWRWRRMAVCECNVVVAQTLKGRLCQRPLLSYTQPSANLPCTTGHSGALYGYVHVATRRRRPTNPSHPRRQRSTLYATERAVLSRVCLLFSKISNLQRLRLLGIILTSEIRYRLRSSKVVSSATRTYKARSYLAYD